MAATKYQVLCRYVNESKNSPITNDPSTKYEETLEFYTDPDHRIFSSNVEEVSEEMEKQQMVISQANNAENPKNDMLFVYNGTKKIRHKKIVREQTGYIVKNWQSIPRSNIGDEGDYTKDFTTLGAGTPEDGGTVVCTKMTFDKYFPTDIVIAASGNYTSAALNKAIQNATIFELSTDGTWKDHCETSGAVTCYPANSGVSQGTLYTGPVFIDEAVQNAELRSYYNQYSANRKTAYGVMNDNTNVCGKIMVGKAQVKTTKLPTHYEESTDNPYMVKDMYKKVSGSPWFINSTCASLASAMEKAKKLIGMIGKENVRVIKVVATDQFIKIK